MNKLYILDELKKYKPVLEEKYGITELALFGSYSRNEQTPASDIDLMVNIQSPLGMKFFDMVYELEELFKDTKIQVVSKKAIKPKYFDIIKEDLIYA